jgi:hypothetical protein
MPQDQDQELSPDQPQDLSTSQGDTPFAEQTIDEHIEKEREEIASVEASDKEEHEPEEEEADTEGQDDDAGEEPDGEDDLEDEGAYKPNAKYKVLDEEHEFDPKLKKLLTKETEPIIRELYEKAHGIESIKSSRTQAIQERDQVQGNYNNLIQEVGRVMNYRKAGDLQSFFESLQISDDEVAKYILEKVRVSQLPPDQQAVYTEREALRRRLNGVEQNLHTMQTQGTSTAVQERLTALDTILGGEMMKRTVSEFDARNGNGSFRTAVIQYAAGQGPNKDLSADEAISGFLKTFGINVPKGQPKPNVSATKRVVARPKVKALPNYGGGQASVTGQKKPRNVEDLRKLGRGESI